MVEIKLETIDMKSLLASDKAEISALKEQVKAGSLAEVDFINKEAEIKTATQNKALEVSNANLEYLNSLKAQYLAAHKEGADPSSCEIDEKTFNSVRKNLTKVKKEILKEQIKIDEIKRAQLKKLAKYAKKDKEFAFDKEESAKAIESTSKAIDKNEQALTLLMNKFELIGFKFIKFGKAIPGFFVNLGKAIARFFVNLFWNTINWFKGIGLTFWHGDWKTKVSYFVMGFGSVMRGQWLRGVLFFLMEVVFILYMALFGGKYLGQFYILGTKDTITLPDGTVIQGDNSFNILLYGALTIFFIIAFIYTWYLNIKQNRIAEEIIRDERKLDTAKDDLRAMVDKNFHKTLLAVPTLGIVMFTILPIFFMILVAFTDYDAQHATLFGWVGFDNFSQLFVFESGGKSFSMTFGQILLWTLVWAFFATFTNYFLGMLVAMLINKKGIKLKKLWRTILVFSIAIPQFISILYVREMFQTDGVINGIFEGIAKIFGNNNYQPIDFWGDPWMARITVIIINIWIGVPYLMLVVTGILMNIPADLYESANIDGANAWQQYSKITLPYMLFITGPYLLTSFTGNMNNFNVIYLLTGGGPTNTDLYGNAGSTDLLITWLYSLAVGKSDYKFAAVIGIMVFIVVAVISLVVYNLIPSTKNEEEFQ